MSEASPHPAPQEGLLNQRAQEQAQAAAAQAANPEVGRFRRALDAVTNTAGNAMAYANVKLFASTGERSSMVERVSGFAAKARLGRMAATAAGLVVVGGAMIAEAKGHDASTLKMVGHALSGTGGGHTNTLDHGAGTAPDMDLVSNNADMQHTATHETATITDFSKGAETIKHGEGWYHQLKEMGITDPKDQAAFLKEHGHELEKQGLAYKMEGGGWGLNLGNGHFERADLQQIHDDAVRDGYLPAGDHAAGTHHGADGGHPSHGDTSASDPDKVKSDPTPTPIPSATTTSTTPEIAPAASAPQAADVNPVASNSESSFGHYPEFVTDVLFPVVATEAVVGVATAGVLAERNRRRARNEKAFADLDAFVAKHPNAFDGLNNTALIAALGLDASETGDVNHMNGRSGAELKETIAKARETLKDSSSTDAEKNEARKRLRIAERIVAERKRMIRDYEPRAIVREAGLGVYNEVLVDRARTYLRIKTERLTQQLEAERARPASVRNENEIRLMQAVLAARSKGDAVSAPAANAAEAPSVVVPEVPKPSKRKTGRFGKPKKTGDAPVSTSSPDDVAANAAIIAALGGYKKPANKAEGSTALTEDTVETPTLDPQVVAKRKNDRYISELGDKIAKTNNGFDAALKEVTQELEGYSSSQLKALLEAAKRTKRPGLVGMIANILNERDPASAKTN